MSRSRRDMKNERRDESASQCSCVFKICPVLFNLLVDVRCFLCAFWDHFSHYKHIKLSSLKTVFLFAKNALQTYVHSIPLLEDIRLSGDKITYLIDLILLELCFNMSFPQNTSNAMLVDFLKQVGHITDERVKEVMLSVDRADFCSRNSYQDFPQQIGYNATISAPHMHALALGLLKDHLRDGNTALDIGSGSGYLTVCMALMVGRRGKVIGIDHIKELVDLSITNINKHHSDLLTDGRITMITGDGRNGYRAGAPYTAIHVGAAASKLPYTLVDQLAPGGRMIIPVGEVFSDQHIVQSVTWRIYEERRLNSTGTYFCTRTMAWRSHGESNASLVENLCRNGLFKDERVRTTMLRVDRADFCPRNPYLDNPEPIGCNATISAPHMHAAALERLKDHLTEGDRALDIGSGSGYLTTCMAYMVGASGKVVGVEHIRQLVDLSISNIKKNHADLLEGRVLMVEGDGREGFPEYAPYKAIHVGAASPNVPNELLNQLAPGGRMLIPVGAAHSDQRFLQVDKDSTGKVTVNDLMGVIYVPLTNKENQIGRNQ
ncbi:unnamed protein product [Litomosoides sigmodontis]|uniref:Protein-L-isoaspartate(D-aspartate) O-methyltransferase n=1 Tax=Litomosoides sigmodontis TaxID=42156 RepID=A0A3P6T594_LITSI|nr:unnamed protein product [Litomosoides sigmodontis]